MARRSPAHEAGGAAQRPLHRNHVGGIERGDEILSILNFVAGLDASLAEFFKPFDKRPKRRPGA